VDPQEVAGLGLHADPRHHQVPVYQLLLEVYLQVKPEEGLVQQVLIVLQVYAVLVVDSAHHLHRLKGLTVKELLEVVEERTSERWQEVLCRVGLFGLFGRLLPLEAGLIPNGLLLFLGLARFLELLPLIFLESPRPLVYVEDRHLLWGAALAVCQFAWVLFEGRRHFILLALLLIAV
jgi:hypothetical protein